MLLPKTEKRRAGKNRKAIKQAVAELREATSDGGSAVELQSLMEQACNFVRHVGAHVIPNTVGRSWSNTPGSRDSPRGES
jgi:hypothetical protein